MLYLVIAIALLVGASHLLKTKLGVSRNTLDHIWIGAIGIGAIEALAHIITGLITGAASAVLLAHLISLLIMGGFTYYLYTKSDLA